MKRRNKFTTKTRRLTTYYGKAKDLLYYAYSVVGYGCQSWTPEQALSLYDSGMAMRATSVNANTFPPLGVEQIITRSGRSTVGNDCTHCKQQVVNLPYLYAAERSTGAPTNLYNYVHYWRSQPYTIFYKNAAEVAMRNAVVNDQMFSARAYWSMRPKLSSDVSLINSIFELKDFADVSKFLFSPNGLARVLLGNRKSLLSVMRSIGNGHKFKSPAPRIRRGYKSAHRYLQSKSLSEHTDDLISRGTKTVADGVLTYNLAIMPTIRDCMAIHAAAQQDVLRKLQEFKAYGDDGSTSHFTENETIFSDVTPGTKYNYFQGSGKLIRIVRTATMTSWYKLLWERFEDMYPKWWGLEVGADEVWNMLPLSFVLDYAMTVGKSLEYMDRDPRIKVLSTEYMESTKVTAELGHYIIQSRRTPQLIIDGKYIMPRSQSKCHLVSGTCGTYYRRKIMEPYKGPALPKLKLPSKKQAANMLALARCLLF